MIGRGKGNEPDTDARNFILRDTLTPLEYELFGLPPRKS